MVRWQSGDAADCKSVYAGSIPARTSNFLFVNKIAPSSARGLVNTSFGFHNWTGCGIDPACGASLGREAWELGWFRLFDRMRLRPATEALEGWGLPGSRLRLTDPHLAAYFRDLAANAGIDIAADAFDLASHMLARSVKPQPGRWHLDLRMMGNPARLMFGAASQHAILSWHAPSLRAELRMPGKNPVTLEQANPLALCAHHLALGDIATLSAWVPSAAVLAEVLQKLEPFVSAQTRAVIRLPGEALASVVAVLPGWPLRPVAALPCEPEPGEAEAETPLDILLCLEALTPRSPAATAARPRANLPAAQLWQAGAPLPEQGGLVVRALEDSLVAGGLLIGLIGDAPPTEVGAMLHGLQRTPLRAEPGHFLRLDAQAARLDGGIVQTVGGVAAVDPALDVDPAPLVTVPDPVREIVDRPALVLRPAQSRQALLAEIVPQLELACEWVEREKLPASGVELVCPAGADAFLRAMLDVCGFGDATIRTQTEGVLFRHLILASRASMPEAASRAAIFDRFWRRMATMNRAGTNRSLTALRQKGRVLLIGPDSLILNAADLISLAQERAYAVIDPQSADPREVAALLRDASVVIAPAQLGIWSVLARRCALGLLQSDVDPEIPYPALHAAGARRHSVLAMFGSGIGDDPDSGFVVAVERLALMMDRLETLLDGMPTAEVV